MRKLSFLKSTFSLVLLLSMSILLVNCSSSSSDDDHVGPTSNTFNPADFALTITETKLNDDSVRISYDIKNITNTSYNNYNQGNFNIRFTVKATDGTIFQDVGGLDYIDAGITKADFTYLEFNKTKTIDLTTLTAVIEKQ
ncbi:hypothetical protein IUY40_01575 [Flavobacterium sp. ALJ2]|uniref:hypothetical protein n=1 Tax=Flavobacterium sp. ALJ2 TaxID=2786960 RepID=UPI00189FB7E9|nr:hypothetical protein [Flavobacterium sp. ALJ2]MBF7090232.1 hypothetical protein [Flavobacterium sp. ALJ2]